MITRRGFTLIELMIVMAVLVLLLALAVPSLKSGKESGVTVICTNHLKQLNLLTAIYCNDNVYFPQGFCSLPNYILNPPEEAFPGDPSYDLAGWWWFHFLDVEDLSEDGILWCPARKRMEPAMNDNILCSNYGMNYSIAKWASIWQTNEFRGRPLRKTELRQPSQTLLYSDSGYALISWKAAADSVTNLFDMTPRETSFYLPGLEMNKNRLIHSEQQDDAVKGRHPRQTVNIGFADGHVQKDNAEDLFVPQDEEGNPSAVSAYIWSPGE